MLAASLAQQMRSSDHDPQITCGFVYETKGPTHGKMSAFGVARHGELSGNSRTGSRKFQMCDRVGANSGEEFALETNSSTVTFNPSKPASW
jgi:hypothetical protein